jgi:outer membrane protein OmpA-like peptidoglycan-associated protein
MPLAGDRHGRAEAMVGAGLAALPAAAVGGYVAREEHDLRMRTAGTGIDFRRRGDEITLGVPAGIAFDALGTVIKPGIRTTLDQIGRTMAQYGQGFVDIYGYAGDDAGGPNLSQGRAQAIAGYLQSRGVAAARLATRGFGRDQAGAVSGPSSDGQVVIRLVPLTEADVAPPAAPVAASAAR